MNLFISEQGDEGHSVCASVGEKAPRCIRVYVCVYVSQM